MPRLSPEISNWLLAALIAAPVSFLTRHVILDYGFYPPFYSQRPLEILGLWLLCYFGVRIARALWRSA